jgi:hypothetical protein
LHFGKQRAPRIELATARYLAGVQGVGGLVLRELA